MIFLKNKLSVEFNIIGFIRSPYTEKKGIPIQPIYSNAEGTVRLFPQYSSGLADLSGFSHIILLYHFHRVTEYKLKVIPFLDDVERGIFATRGPLRPNPIGVSIVELTSIDIDNHEFKIKGIDVLDKTPLLDIKPYVPQFDNRKAKSGWIKSSDFSKSKISNGRF
ncbi:MAG: tRNA (N6-threonylcarbamoyladenosine(37)-N6)-methyltransferase TrmO [Candidatus Hodarchaeales archaeon]